MLTAIAVIYIAIRIIGITATKKNKPKKHENEEHFVFLTVKWEGRKGAEWKCVFIYENLARVAVWSTRCTMHTMWLTSGVRPRRFRPPSSDLCRVCPRKGPEKERRGSSSHIWRREYWKRWENKVEQCRESEALRGWWEERRQHSWKDWIFLCFWFHLSFALA